MQVELPAFVRARFVIGLCALAIPFSYGQVGIHSGEGAPWKFTRTRVHIRKTVCENFILRNVGGVNLFGTHFPVCVEDRSWEKTESPPNIVVVDGHWTSEFLSGWLTGTADRGGILECVNFVKGALRTIWN